MIRRLLILLASLLPALPAHAPAQNLQTRTLTERGYQPVDPFIGDTEPLHRSLRQIQPGIGTAGEGFAVFRRPDDPVDKLYIVRPGVIAEYDRSQYVDIRVKKHFFTFQMIPPNTVFHLAEPPPPQPLAPPPDSPLMIQAGIDRRLGSPASPLPAASAFPRAVPQFPLALHDWPAYLRFRQTQRENLLHAIDQAAQLP